MEASDLCQEVEKWAKQYGSGALMGLEEIYNIEDSLDEYENLYVVCRLGKA
jgi:ribosomal protein S24E